MFICVYHRSYCRQSATLFVLYEAQATYYSRSRRGELHTQINAKIQAKTKRYRAYIYMKRWY